MTNCDALRLVDAQHIKLAEPLFCPRLDHCSIHSHGFFNHLRDEDIATLCQRSRLLKLDARQMLCREGEPAKRFFIVVSGSVKLFRVSDQGSERILGSAGPGQVIGETNVCEPGGTYPFYAQCVEDSEVRSFSGAVFKDLMEERPDYIMEVMGYLSGVVRESLNDREIMSSQSARDRLVRYILRHLPVGESDLEMPLPKGLTASQLAMQPETLSRILTDLRRQEIIDIDRRQIHVRDRAALEQLVV